MRHLKDMNFCRLFPKTHSQISAPNALVHKSYIAHTFCVFHKLFKISRSRFDSCYTAVFIAGEMQKFLYCVAVISTEIKVIFVLPSLNISLNTSSLSLSQDKSMSKPPLYSKLTNLKIHLWIFRLQAANKCYRCGFCCAQKILCLLCRFRKPTRSVQKFCALLQRF